MWLIVVVVSSTAVAGAEGALFEPGVVATVTGVRLACLFAPTARGRRGGAAVGFG